MNAYTLVTVILITLLAMSIIVTIGVFGGKVFRDRRDRKFEQVTQSARDAVLDDAAIPALEEVYRRAARGEEFWQNALLTVFEEWERDGVFTDTALTDRVTPPNAAVTRDALMLQVHVQVKKKKTRNQGSANLPFGTKKSSPTHL